MESKWLDFQYLLNRYIFSGRKNNIQRYVFPIILALVVVIFKSGLLIFLGDEISFHFMVVAVIFSAWYGGLGPGIFATIILGILNYYLFLRGPFSLTLDERSVLLTLLFFLEGILVSIVSEAKKEAEDQKDEFISFASHELKNPLAVVKGYCDLVARRALKLNDSRLFDYARTAETNVNKVNELVNDLLDITKIHSGKLIYHDEEIFIQDLIVSVIRDQQLISKTHQIKLSGKSHKYLMGDRYRLGQVLVNLITNAIKYSPKSKKIFVSVKDIAKGTEVSVKDKGIGMSDQEQERIFQRFFRVKKASQEKIEGLGIGLYISSIIIKRHKAKISIKSKLGKGSTFFVYIPSYHK